MTIKRKQIAVWNKKCGNGFEVNLRQAIWRGRKYLHKYIRLSPEYLLEVSIKWKTERDFRNKPWAYPILHILFFGLTNGMKKVICFQARLERDTRLDYKRIGDEKISTTFSKYLMLITG